MRTHRDALSIFEGVPRLWRRLRGRCLGCGARRERHAKCLHCWAGGGRLCHRCGKNHVYGHLYGAPPDPNCRCFVQVPDEFGRRIEVTPNYTMDPEDERRR